MTMTGNCENDNHHTCKGGGGVKSNHKGHNTLYICSCGCHKLNIRYDKKKKVK